MLLIAGTHLFHATNASCNHSQLGTTSEEGPIPRAQWLCHSFQGIPTGGKGGIRQLLKWEKSWEISDGSACSIQTWGVKSQNTRCEFRNHRHNMGVWLWILNFGPVNLGIFGSVNLRILSWRFLSSQLKVVFPSLFKLHSLQAITKNSSKSRIQFASSFPIHDSWYLIYHISQHQVSSLYMSAKTQRWFPSSQKLQLLHLELQVARPHAPPLAPTSWHHVAAGRSVIATCFWRKWFQ